MIEFEKIIMDKNLNTSHVKVKRFTFFPLFWIHEYLNTSHVKVKHMENYISIT